MGSLGLPRFLERIYLARGIDSAEDLELSLKHLLDNSAMKGLETACDLLFEALRSRQRILVLGDFDADGATSTSLAVLALRQMGASYCDFLVPNRFEYGYGLTPEIVDLAFECQPDLIVTVDNGISSIEGVERAHELGIKVLVTDHHLPGDSLPNADAIVNPNQADCSFESKNAAGVGVIFYVLARLRTFLREKGWFEQQHLKEPNLGDYLDLVALGTVADLVPLDRNNRILVDQGLRRMRAGRCRPGILALLRVAGKDYRQLLASDLGFMLGPRLNAAGRLDDMSLGINCLLEPDPDKAFELAQALDQLNQQRKQIEEEMKRDALAQLETLDLDKQGACWSLCLYQEHWHQGVIGILASRIKEKLHCPVIVFAPEDDDPHKEKRILKGSARSIPGLHMRDTLDLVAKKHPTLLKKFGGHAMAAGMSLEAEHFEAFTAAFEEAVRTQISEDALEATLVTDGELGIDDLNLDAVTQLELAGPWGQQFPEPSFDGVFRVAQSRVLKDKHLKLVLNEPSSGALYDAIQFNSDWVNEPIPERVRVVYRPNINEFRGRRSVQFFLDYIEADA